MCIKLLKLKPGESLWVKRAFNPTQPLLQWNRNCCNPPLSKNANALTHNQRHGWTMFFHSFDVNRVTGCDGAEERCSESEEWRQKTRLWRLPMGWHLCVHWSVMGLWGWRWESGGLEAVEGGRVTGRYCHGDEGPLGTLGEDIEASDRG